MISKNKNKIRESFKRVKRDILNTNQNIENSFKSLQDQIKKIKDGLKQPKITFPFQKSGQYDWETPQDFFDELNKEFNFTLDPCCTKENAKTDIYFTEEDNGLEKNWEGHIVFMNPPYGNDISKWVKKAYEESLKGITVVCLLPVRTDTNWWWDYCMKGEIRFIRGRLRFKGKNTKGKLVNYPATFSNAIVIFKNKNDKIPEIPPSKQESRLIKPINRLITINRETKETSDKLDIDSFSEKEKNILKVFFKHKDMALSYVDIAKVLNKSPNTIKFQISRIRERINIFEIAKDEQNNKNRFKLKEGLKIEKTLID